METFAELIGFVTGFFDWIYTFLTETIVQVMKDFIEWMTIQLIISWIDTKIWLVQFSWSVAGGVLDAFNVSSVVSSYVSGLSGGVGYIASGAGLFDAFNLIAQAYVASMVLRWTGF